MINQPTGMQRVLVFGLSPVALLLLACLGLIVLAPLRELLGVAGVVGYAVFALISVAALAWAMLRVTRWAIWLEGTQLVARDAFTTRRCDLATAPVHLTTAGWYVRVPTLRVRESEHGRWLKVPLRSANQQLVDPVPLRALAAAINAPARPEPYRGQATQVVTALHQLADNPAVRLL